MIDTLDDVLDAVMTAIEDTLEAQDATLYLIDPETGELIFTKVKSGSDNPPAAGIRLPAGTGIVGWVATTKNAILIHNTHRIKSNANGVVC